MMCRPTTVLHGGVCHCTSTPHKSGNKMKEKKKKICRTGTFTSASVENLATALHLKFFSGGKQNDLF